MNDNEIHKILQESIKGSGQVNIIIAGKTGVGKSTLINSVFRGDLAKTGTGEPVTQKAQAISKKGLPLTIIDTKGLELKDYQNIIDDLEEEIQTRSKSADENKHIHAAWICIHEEGKRIEEAERQLCEMFRKCSIPVLIVFTKCKQKDNLFLSEATRLLPTAKAFVRVRAISETITDDDDDSNSVTLKVFGIDKLIEETGKLLPDSMKRAYSNALNTRHKMAVNLKVEQAKKEVNIAAAAATAAAAVPIPFSDAVTLVPIQVGMLAKIGITFGMETSTATLTTLVSAVIGSSAATLVGRTVVANILKFVPGIGSALGGAIAASTAGALTKGLGDAYIATLESFIVNNPGSELNVDLILSELKKKMSFS